MANRPEPARSSILGTSAVLLLCAFALEAYGQNGCPSSVSPTSIRAGSDGGTFRVVADGSAACVPTATASAPWIAATVGPAVPVAAGVRFEVTIQVAGNPAGSERSGAVALGQLVVGVAQDAASCVAAVAPTSFAFGAAGGTGTVQVELPAGCPLVVRPEVPWITVAPSSTDPAETSGAVAFLVGENRTPSPREGTLTVAGVPVRVAQQAGAVCTPLPPPALRTPTNGSAGLPASVSLSWSASSGAAVYDVYLGTTPDPPLVAGGVTATTWPASKLAPGRTWYWRVAARRENVCAETPGSTSETWSFATAPECVEPGELDLVAPPDGSAGLPSSLDLEWQASEGAGSYDLFLGTSSPPRQVAAGLTETRFRASGLAPGAKYVWTVVARAACDPRRTRATRTGVFAVGGACAPPSAPVLLGPDDGASLPPGGGTFTWTPSAGSASYDLYLGVPGALSLHTRGLIGSSLPVPDLPPGEFAWRIVARSGCSAASAASPDRRFRVSSRCDAPPPPTILSRPAGPVAAGQSYVLTWTDVSGLGEAGGYHVERSSDPSFRTLTDRQSTAARSATFLPNGPGTLYHRVLARSSCPGSPDGTPSAPVAVEVVAGAPNVVFTRPPEPLLVGLGESLAGRRVRFVVENIGTAPATVLMGQGRSTAEPFFRIVDPDGGDPFHVTLEPRRPKAFDIAFEGVSADRAETYNGVVFCTAATSNLAVTPFAFVTLRVAADGALASASPEVLFDGRPAARVDFPPFVGADESRPALSLTIRNPGAVPMELVEEIGPEAWLETERGWNAAPLAPGATRTLRLSTRREKAPDASGFPRYTYLVLRARGGGVARVLVVDNDVLEVGRGRSPLPTRGERSRIVPAVVRGSSALGNAFVSRVDLTNAGTSPVPAELVFTPAGVDGFDAAAVRRAVVVVPPNDVVRLEDPVGGAFGVEAPSYGTLEVRSPEDRTGFLTVTASVDTPSGGGSLGFALPVLTRGEGARLGAPHALGGIVAGPSRRTNVLLVETTGVEATLVRLTLRGPSGAHLGVADAEVPRYGLTQVNSVVPALSGAATLDGGSLEVEVLEGGGAVAAVATVIDGRNDDASAAASRPVALRPGWTGDEPPSLLDLTVRSVVPSLVGGFPTFPGTARSETFTTRLVLTSLSSAPATFQLEYRDLESGQTTSRTVEVPGRATLRYDDAVVALFGRPPGARTQGPLFVDSTPNGLLLCEVYSTTPEGQLGDALPVIPVPGAALTGPDSAVPLFAEGLEQATVPGTGTRSNLILNEVGGRPARVRVRLYEASNRTQAIAERELDVAPLQKVQLSTVFRELGLDTEERRKDRTNVLVSVTPADGTEGLVSAVVTRIDNATGDTRNFLLTPSGGVGGAGGITIGF